VVAVTVSVVIPWRGGCPRREAALAWTLDRWRAAGHEPVLGEAAVGPWCKAAAVAAGLPRTSGEVLVIADADVWTDGVNTAVAAVEAGAPWAIPHRDVRRLTGAASAQVLAGADLGDDLPVAQRPYRGYEGGGITVLPRSAYAQVPLDARFAGWGQEDESWALALRTLVGAPWRGTTPLWHLWHPPQVRESRRWGSGPSRALWQRYRRAAGNRDAMKEVVLRGTAGDRRRPGSAPRP
jgi:hypothetical protein